MPTLHWLNDDEARRAARDVPYRLLLANGYFYPDFVSELKDGRTLVVEY